MRFSLLDRSRTRAGQPDGQGLHDTIARARWAESLGFHRFWVAEHHAVPGVALGAPAVLLAAIGQVTESIRLGSGGVMLPQHQPLVVAEQFRMLEALHPGRIDLGVGRSLGFTPAVRRALRREEAAVDDFEAELGELLDYLDDSAEVTARPATGPVPVFALATRSGIASAARLGLPVVVGGPLVQSPELSEVLAEYREAFRRSDSAMGVAAPQVILAVEVFAAADEQRARELALPEAWAMVRTRRTGEFSPLEPPERILAQEWPDRLRRRVETQLDQAVTGTVDQAAGQLRRLVDASGADEILAITSTYDLTALHDLDAALIQVGRLLSGEASVSSTADVT